MNIETNASNKNSGGKSSKKKWIAILLSLAAIIVAGTLVWFFMFGKNNELSKDSKAGDDSVLNSALTQEKGKITPNPAADIEIDTSALYVTNDASLYYYDEKSDKSLYLSDNALR